MGQTTPNITSAKRLVQTRATRTCVIQSAQACALDTTRLRKMCVRRGVQSSLPVACATFANVCPRNNLAKTCGMTSLDLSIGNLAGPQMGPAQTVSSCGLDLQTNHDIAQSDLAIECFGGQAVERLDVRVRVATNFVEDDEEEEDCAK